MDSVKCELCGLEHMPGAKVCDGCDHVLGQALDLQAMLAERQRVRERVGTALSITLATFVFSLMLFQGRAWLLLVVGPLSVAVPGIFRWRALSARIRAARRERA